jgi:hypothetical protein
MAHHDIDADIPASQQPMVRLGYYTWLATATGYMWNWFTITLMYASPAAALPFPLSLSADQRRERLSLVVLLGFYQSCALRVDICVGWLGTTRQSPSATVGSGSTQPFQHSLHLTSRPRSKPRQALTGHVQL